MQSYGGRDQAISSYCEKLLQAGAVDEEFQLFGCMYLEKGEQGFFVTEREQKMFRFQMECEQKNCYCTPVSLYTYWSKVTKGERQMLKRQYQFDVIKKLEQQYGDMFFHGITNLEAIPPTDAAVEVLDRWKKQLDSCYDLDLLQLYEAIISAALQMKILTPFSGLRYLEWIGRMKQQFQEDMLQQEGEAHVYAGLAYLDENDGIRYLQFGKQYAAWQKHQELLLKGKTVSPVFLKTLYYTANDFQTIQAKRREFVACMQDKMNKKFFVSLEQLYTLPRIIASERYQAVAEKAEQFFCREEKIAFQLYGRQLRLV